MKFKILALIMTMFVFLTGCAATDTGANVIVDENITEETNEVEEKEDTEKKSDTEIKEEYKEAIGIYFGIERNKAHINVLDVETDFNNFTIESSIKEKLEKMKSHRLLSLEFRAKDGLLKEVKEIESAKIRATFNGMADNNFGEFNVNGYVNVFQISEELKEKFHSMETGKEVMITIVPSETEGANLIVIQLH
ncbi:hypothetical protein [Alkalithermobacter paradoxus]|uniref:Lipoprotein n=1 Tax=Alkalithermobacter paradoxus TaxID=29349 RepID=A0A1V4I4S1_9FIRM|nr:hypothetical protein CLOTH_17750 [[Clostridium] thermoalcaliphilum]